MSDHLNVVVAQNPAELDGSEARLRWLRQAMTNIREEQPDLLVLPELFLTGYNIGDRVSERAEPRDGPFAQQIAALARHNGVAIHYGFAERDGAAIYNSASCFSRQGDYLGGHRKLLLPPGFERDHFTGGDGCTLFEIGSFRIATLICYDLEFPENLRAVATRGADLVVAPTALEVQWRVVSERLVPTRAFENGVFLCYANQCGIEGGMRYFGGSCIVGPDGKDLARADAKEALLSARLARNCVAEAQTRLPYLKDRNRLPWDT